MYLINHPAEVLADLIVSCLTKNNELFLKDTMRENCNMCTYSIRLPGWLLFAPCTDVGEKTAETDTVYQLCGSGKAT